MRKATPILLVIVALLAGGTLWQTQRVHTAVTAIPAAPEAKEMGVMETSWKDKLGATHTVKTEQRVGETYDEWVARHKGAVDALQAVFPPVA